jgi:hypothetical protein
MSLRRLVVTAAGLATVLLAAGAAHAFPVNGAADTGIQRLYGYQVRPGHPSRLPRGARLDLEQIHLRMLEHPDMTLPAVDPTFSEQITKLLGDYVDDYSVAVLDLSDPDHPAYGEVNPNVHRTPGSVGKIVVALALFQALADAHPNDLDARRRVLHDAQVTADAFIYHDHHKVPLWQPDSEQLRRRPLVIGDTANLWTYLDWMLSASSNAAATTVIQQAMLLAHFGARYPLPQAEEEDFFVRTPRRELSALLERTLQSPVTRNGLNLADLRQGGFFTLGGKRRVPGTNSTCTARELVRYLLRLEQGRLVDAFSSLEIKRLLYMTERRIRYASSPALNDAAVYFKSGSYYRCKPEEGFRCRKYRGNRQNLMNSVAIVEWPAGKPKLFYLVAVTSNVLRKNSAVEHQTLATRLQRLIEARHSEPAGSAR